MKKITSSIVFFLLLVVSQSLFATNSLRVQHPQFWSNATGSIKNATLSITPAGIYTQYDLFMDFSSGNYLQNSFNSSPEDSIEVQYYFELPEDAIVTDSWLWVEDQIVIADLRDRETAHEIFEGIVQRRQDPSILYKNSDTQYELRIYPLIPEETRRVKITFLLPNTWTESTVSTTLPLNFLSVANNSAFSSDLKVIVNHDENWTSPKIVGVDSPIQEQNAIVTTILKENLDQPLRVSYSSPLEDGVFLQKHPISETSGYYQLAVLPSEFLPSSTENKKVAISFNHNSSSSSIDNEQVWNDTREALKASLNANDQFNIFYTQFSTKMASESWIDATDEKIDSVFNALWLLDPLRSSTNLASLLGDASDFIDNNSGEGSILLLSSSYDFNNTTDMNLFIDDFITHTSNHPLEIVEYYSLSSPNFWINGSSYRGNAYVYSRLAALTEGSYTTIEGSDLFTEINQSLSAINEKISVFDISTDIHGFGFTYSDIPVSENSLNRNFAYTQIGKYLLDSTFEISLVAETSTGIVGQTKEVSNFLEDTDSVSFQIWADKKIRSYGTSTTDFNSIGNIIELSFDARVLSRHTAFLALDPNEFDNVTVCDDCIDPNEHIVGIDDDFNSVEILQTSVYPNPVEDVIHVIIELPQSFIDLEGFMTLTSTDGLKLIEIPITGAEAEQELELILAEYGLDLEQGLYLLTIQLGEFTKTVKIHKT